MTVRLKSFAFGILGCLIPLMASGVPDKIDGIVAIVNDGIITQSELNDEIELVKQNLMANRTVVPEPHTLEKQVLDRLIHKTLQLQYAEKTGLTIDETALNQAIANVAQNNQLSVMALKEALKRDGIRFEVFRDNIHNQLTLSQLQSRDVASRIQITEDEINTYLVSQEGLASSGWEYELGHILVSMPQSPDPAQIQQAKEKANALKQRLIKGEPIANLAAANSNDELAFTGGSLGWRQIPQLPTLFVKAVTVMEPNEVQGPIQSPSGFHLIKLLGKRLSQDSQLNQTESKVAHILLRPNENLSAQQAQAQLHDLRARILAGEDFATLAKTHSKDLASTRNGGELGWVTDDVLVPEFAEKINTLKLNEISEPFKTQFGWHIVHLLERRQHLDPQNQLREKAKKLLHQRKFEEQLVRWQRQLKEESFVKTFLSENS